MNLSSVKKRLTKVYNGLLVKIIIWSFMAMVLAFAVLIWLKVNGKLEDISWAKVILGPLVMGCFTPVVIGIVWWTERRD